MVPDSSKETVPITGQLNTQAYVAAKRLRDAANALQEARVLGLKPTALHPFERRAYDQLVAAPPKK